MTQLARIGGLPLRPAELDTLAALAGGTLEEATAETECALISTGRALTAEDLDALPRLRHLAVCGTSYGRIDLNALAARGVTTSNVVDYSDETTAEVIFMQLVSVSRGYGNVQWRAEPHELYGTRLLVVGLGALGASVARLGLAYGMAVSHLSRSPKPEWEARGVARADAATAFASADVVVLTGPTDVVVATAERLAQLRDAILVQASVGHVTDEVAFRNWIDRGDNCAVFDLVAGEDTYEAYSQHPRVVFPRAISGYSDESRQRLGEQVVANVRAAMGI